MVHNVLCIVHCTVVYRTLYCCVSHAVLLCIVHCTVVYRTLYCCVSYLCVLGSLANGRQLFLATKILVCVQQHFLEQHSFITLVVLHMWNATTICSLLFEQSGVLFKVLIVLLVNNYAQLYVHIYCCPNNTLNPTLVNPNPTNQIRALKCTPIL